MHGRRLETNRRQAVQCRQGKWSCFVSVEYMHGICFLPHSALLLDDVSWLYATWNLTRVSTCSMSMTPPTLIASLNSWQSDSTNQEPRDVAHQLWRPTSPTEQSCSNGSALHINCDDLHHQQHRAAATAARHTSTTSPTAQSCSNDSASHINCDDLHHQQHRAAATTAHHTSTVRTYITNSTELQQRQHITHQPPHRCIKLTTAYAMCTVTCLHVFKTWNHQNFHHI